MRSFWRHISEHNVFGPWVGEGSKVILSWSNFWGIYIIYRYVTARGAFCRNDGNIAFCLLCFWPVGPLYCFQWVYNTPRAVKVTSEYSHIQGKFTTSGIFCSNSKSWWRTEKRSTAVVENIADPKFITLYANETRHVAMKTFKGSQLTFPNQTFSKPTIYT